LGIAGIEVDTGQGQAQLDGVVPEAARVGEMNSGLGLIPGQDKHAFGPGDLGS
jgi:hypothetical protein